MKKPLIWGFAFALAASLSVYSAPGAKISKDPKTAQNHPIAIIIHGGAGNIQRSNLTPEEDRAYRQALSEALHKGYAVLQKGGTSVEAVQTAIRFMENSPLFNAGRGAVFTHSGRIQLDSAIMDGKTHKAGSVGAVEHIAHPISLAALVMERSPHVLLVGSGAEEFALEEGVKLVPQSYFKTMRRFKQLQQHWKKDKLPWSISNESGTKDHGTVGCAALDRYGNIAAGTSTGGLTDKLDGRVGDSPIIGAGTYADNATCAISATGIGEFFQRYLVTYDVSAQMRLKGMTLKQAADYEIHDRLMKLAGPGSGGVIALDRKGDVTAQFNTKGMFRGWIDTHGRMTVALYGDRTPLKAGEKP
ncbi:MAG: isoaspartyl peptidase/L-asparaginase [Acidobacteriota bacterium]